jgi:hypothetical protein
MKKKNFFQVLFLGTAMMAGFLMTSCNNDDNNNTTKVDPGTIATANLVAYFPFNGNATETINSLNPSNTPTVTYVAGRRGQCLQGAANGYMLYNLPTGNKLKSLTAFTVAMWLKAPQIPAETAPVPIFLQICNDDDLFWGNLTLTQDRMGTLLAPVDSINLKMVFHKEGASWNNQWLTNMNKPAFQAASWMYMVFEYDNVTSSFNVYVNGVLIGFPDSFTKRYAGDIVNGVQPALGDLAFNKANKMVIGGWMPKIANGATDEWMGWFLGNMDELRIFDKALTATQVLDLYHAEVSQLN